MKVVTKYKYERIRQIGVGQGLNSEVYLAHDPQLGGEVAVKEIEKAKLPRPAADYFAEAKAMFKSEHPNVVAIRTASQTKTHICLSMPFYKKGSLADRIASSPLPVSEIQRVGQQILSGLEAIHAGGSIHFDVKPSNILFSDKNVAMVADFGQARSIGSGGVTTMPPMYSRGLPPEFYLTGIGSPRSDVFQAGLTLYRAVNGDAFFRDQLTGIADLRDAITRGRFPDRNRFMPHVPKALRTVIRKALQVNPTNRYQTAVQFGAALGNVDPSLDWKTTISPSGTIEWRSVRRHQPDLVVRLGHSAHHWNVRLHTDGSSQRACRKNLWLGGCTRAQALGHLKHVFQSLG